MATLRRDDGGGRPADARAETRRVRSLLSKLRTIWAEHAPCKPLYLEEELEPGLTIAQFCVTALTAQRAKRYGRRSESSPPADGLDGGSEEADGAAASDDADREGANGGDHAESGAAGGADGGADARADLRRSV